MPHPLRPLFLVLSRSATAAAIARRAAPPRVVRRFVAGPTLAAAVGVAAALRARGMQAALNALGERAGAPGAAQAARDTYVAALRALAKAGLTPHVALKPSHLGATISPDLCRGHLAAILAEARAVGGFVRLDMEASRWTDATLDLHRFARACHPETGVAIQANLRRSPEDVAALDPLAPRLRLVKGAYAEPRSAAWQKPADIAAALRALLERQLRRGFPTALGSHDPAIVAFARRRASALGTRLDFEVLLGVGAALADSLVAGGELVRVYVPFGADWLPYFARRLAERPAALWWALRR